ncbi:molybdopterin synthase catalytic subunit [Paenibacillus polysaccharolyticus]|uniref:Molybdopterin synthase catalytic subunit n=2 Tax=Paenibacillus TaxID=44249 RepID=A0A1G5I8Z3_9BACL|nr:MULTISPECIES: molybdenum cofactor biosynthesis protein MoaE [Paenibacillus]MBY0201714.1 molybdenum cofactor biosynthesis protein MoaE [Paenibacillus cucumis (ex Kampfer et al. 2016)]SCY72417.1 molybdopterin synthase catalytic subunit [Paenibacillus polysaccharolyticus]
MKLTIQLFAGIAERLNTSQLEFEYDGDTLTAAMLKEQLSQAYPEAATQIRSSFLAVNQRYAPADTLLKTDDELALIPPVSGGDGSTNQDEDHPYTQEHRTEDGLFLITNAPLSVEATTDMVITANHGAALTFVGTTREMTGEQRTVHLEYEAYVPMALSHMAAIGKEIAERWPGVLCAISHRIGKVDVAEISVVIAVSSPHRSDCYDASRYAIERLKQTVPIWKKEIWEDGSEWKGHQLGPWNPMDEKK